MLGPPLGSRRVGIRSAYTHDTRKPARLREGLQHQDQKDRERRRQKRSRPTEQPRPEDKPQEENRRREAKAPAHQHRRERVLSQNVDHYDPQDDQQGPVYAVLGQGQNHGWRHRQGEADPGYEAQKEGQNAPHQRKVNPEDEHQNGHASPGNEVYYGPQPQLAHHVPAEDGQALYLRMVAAYTGAQPVHHGGSLCEQEQHDYQDQEQVAEEVCDAGQHAAYGSGKGAWFHRVADIHLRKPRTPEQVLKVAYLHVQLPRVGCDVPAEPGDGDAHDQEDPNEEHRQSHKHENQGQGGWNPVSPQPGVDRAEEEAQDHSEEDGVENRRGQAHPYQHDHRGGKADHHAQDGGLAQRRGYGFTDAGPVVCLVVRGFVHDPASELRLALLPNSVHSLFKLSCVVPSPADAAVFPPWFASFCCSPTSFPSNRLPHSDVVGGDEEATAGSFASLGVRR